MYDMTQPVLFGDDQHRVQQALHRIRRANQGRPKKDIGSKIVLNRGVNLQFVRFVNEKDGHLLRWGVDSLSILLRSLCLIR